MANTTLLGSIRKKFWLIITVIGVSLLAFVVDPQSISNFSLVSKDVLGKVNGEKILVSEYNELLDQASSNQQFQNMPKNMLASRVWDQLVQQKIIENKFNNLGLEVTEEMVNKYISKDPQIAQNPEFQGQNGKFSMEKLEAFINTKSEEAKKGDPQAIQQVKSWNQTKNNLKQSLMSNTYFGLISSGLLSNQSEVDFVKKELQKNATAKYVKLPYSEHTNKAGKISDEEIETYINANAKQFKVKENRDLGYVLFASEPSQKDLQTTLQQMSSFTSGKIETDKVTGITDTIQAFGSVKNDSLYVMTHSEQPYSPNYFYEEQLPAELQSFAKSASVGSVNSPIRIQNFYILSKLQDKKGIIDSIEVSHILIGHAETTQKINKRSKAEAKALAEDALAKIKATPLKFYELLALTDDKGSIQSGGKYVVRYGDNQFVPEFISFANNNSVGTINVIETAFGYHIIKVDRKSNAKTGYKLANIVKNIQLSSETSSKIYKQASTLIQNTKAKSLSEFANQARKNKYKYFTANGIEYFGAINNLNTDKDQEIIKWAFDKKRDLGETSMFTTANGDYIITYLAGINEEGVETVKKARERVEPILRNQKIAKALQEEINKISNKDLTSIATKYKKQVVSTNTMLASSFFEGVNEPKVIGELFALKNNQTSKPIEGKEGVYIVQLHSIKSNAQLPMDNEQITIQLNTLNKRNVDTLFKDIKDESDITDRRQKILQ